MKKNLPFFLIALATILLYWKGLSGGFVWDDRSIIVENLTNRDLSNIFELFSAPDTTGSVFYNEQESYYRPINRLTYMLEYQLYGLNPLGYHLVNVMLHLFSVFLLYTLIHKLFLNDKLAFISALIFSVHPINAEAVNFISARNTILATIFVLSSFIMYVHATKKQKTIYFHYSGLLFFVGLFCKETALMLPFLLILYEFTISESITDQIKHKVKFLLLLILFIIIYFAMRKNALSSIVGIDLKLDGLGARILQNIYIIPKYLLNFILPVNLNADYLIPQNSLSNIAELFFVWMIILFLLFYLLRRKNTATIFGLMWYIINFIPISNIVPIPSAPMADRYMYLPVMGLCIIVADYFLYLYTKGIWSKTIISSGIIVLLAFSFITIERNLDWKDSFSLFRSIVKSEPNSAAGHYNLACAFAEKGDLLSAKRELEKTLEILPDHSKALDGLGTIYFELHSFSKAKEYYYNAIKSNPDNCVAHYNLALTLEKLNEPEAALLHYQIFLSRVPPTYGYLIPEVKNKINKLISSKHF